MAEQIRMFGAPWCPDCKRSKQFLNEQRIPFEWNDIDQDMAAQEYVKRVNYGKQIIPTIVFEDGSILVEPSDAELAEKLGIKRQATRKYYDLIIVGGGPAGLTAGIYVSGEGMSTLIVERSGIGGQAGITQEIENYPGFPDAVSGADLADRILKQAEPFDVEILAAQEMTSLQRDGKGLAVKVQSRHEAKVDKVDAAVQVGVSRWEEPQKGLALTGYLEERACVAINDASCRTSQKETRVETWVGTCVSTRVDT